MKKNSGGSDLNIIASGTEIDGTVVSAGNINVEGRIKGRVECAAQFMLGENGVVEGDVIANDAIIGGKVMGSLIVKNKITLESKSHVSGEMKCARLSIEEGAVFEGRSSMGGSTDKLIGKAKSDKVS